MGFHKELKITLQWLVPQEESFASIVSKMICFGFLLGSAAYKKLVENLTRPRLITAIRKLSDYHQTSSLEAKHALDNQFATKKIYYPYHSLMARYIYIYIYTHIYTIYEFIPISVSSVNQVVNYQLFLGYFVQTCTLMRTRGGNKPRQKREKTGGLSFIRRYTKGKNLLPEK